MSYVTLADLYGLGQDTSAATPTSPSSAPPAPKVGFWSLQAQAVQAPVSTPDWNQVGTLATALITKATAAGVIPVATAAQAVQTATQAITSGTGSAAVAQTAVASLLEAAQFEDNATDMDRDVAQQIINAQIVQFSNDVSAWNTKNSGWYALWDKIKGGANTSSLDAELQQLTDTINTTPLTILGRRQLTNQLNLTSAGINRDIDWGTVAIAVGTIVGVAALQWSISKAQSVAATHAQKHWTRLTGGKAEAEKA